MMTVTTAPSRSTNKWASSTMLRVKQVSFGLARAIAERNETCSIFVESARRHRSMDVYGLDTWQRAIPHETFTRLRKESPVHFNPEPVGAGFWAVSKHADVVTISKDPKTFSSARGGTNLTELPPEELSIVQMLMVNMDPPRHNKFRNLVSKGFTPRIIAQLEPLV